MLFLPMAVIAAIGFSCGGEYHSYNHDIGDLVCSHGGNVERIAVHSITTNRFCQYGSNMAPFRKKLFSVFGRSHACVLNHIVVPNWVPNCRGIGIERLVGKGAICEDIPSTCDWQDNFQTSLAILDEVCVLEDSLEYLNSQVQVNEFDTEASNNKLIEWYSEKLAKRKIMLQTSLHAEYLELIAKSFEAVDTNSPGCKEGTGTYSERFELLYCKEPPTGLCKCIDHHKSNVNNYIQDHFLIYSDGDKTTFLRSLGPDGSPDKTKDAEFVRKQCDCDVEEEIVNSNLMFEGGDILVSDKFILVGKDIVLRYLLGRNKKDTLFKKLDLPINLKMNDYGIEELRKAIEKELTGGRKKVILVGTKDRMFFDDERKLNWSDGGGSFQPAYHLDVFMALIGEISDKPGVFKYLIAMPEIEHYKKKNEKSTKEYIANVRSKTRDMVSLLNADIKKVLGEGVTVDTIQVPMLATSVESGDQAIFSIHSSLVNGISFVRNDSSLFVYPDHKDADTYPYSHFFYATARLKFKESLNAHQVFPIGVINTYGDGAGLHCRSKVIRRTY